MRSNYLFELGTEELPPKALQGFSDALAHSLSDQLTSAGLSFDALQSYNSPRRLAVLIEGLSDAAPRSQTKIWGPPANVAFKDGEPTKAALGFCQRNKVAISAASIESDGKADKLCVCVEQGGEPTSALLPGFIETALNALPIPKRMRWGARRTEFVRPTRWLVLMKNDDVLPASFLGLRAGNTSWGHRFLSSGELTIAHADDYLKLLETEGKVIADPKKRQSLILDQVRAIAAKQQGEAMIDEDLLNEVTALVEWPVALLGKFDERFLSVPSEALISSMKEHQKYFHLVGHEGNLLPYFITVSNIEADDYTAIISGNEKVIRPRLDDAAFFFETDKKTSLESRREKLKSVVFQAQLGSIFDKTERMKALSQFICSKLSIADTQSQRCAELCKSDLVSSMVYEFADMQGIAGYHYALNDGEDPVVAQAIAEHYLPKYAGDDLPEHDAGAIVAIADRIDTIVGIFGIGQNPSGSKDPFGLRRASVATLRLIVEKAYGLDLAELLQFAAAQFRSLPKQDTVVETALSYILERFRAWYEEAKIDAEVFMSVSSKQLSEPLDIHRRVLAVSEFSQSDDAIALAAANKRVANILAKLGTAPSGELVPSLLKAPQEQVLARALEEKMAKVMPLFKEKAYAAGLAELADLRTDVDAFFDHVMVMDEDPALQQNRLILLQKLRQLFLEVADISMLVPAK